MRLKISHETVYRYGQPIRNLVQSLRLTPSVFEGQKTHEWQVDVSGGVKGPGSATVPATGSRAGPCAVRSIM